MEELLNDFLAETADHLEQVGTQIVHFEQDPSDRAAIANIFRLVHTIKGTCGFLELNRLEKIAHAAETLIGTVREQGRAASPHVSLILCAIDRIRIILDNLEANGREPEGDDQTLIVALESAAAEAIASAAVAQDSMSEPAQSVPAQMQDAKDVAQVAAAVPGAAPEQSAASAPRESSSIRVAVGTIERIMRLVSELVLTRNQLLEIARSQPNEDFSAPLQRLSSVTSDLQDGVMHARMQPIERLFGPLPRMIRDLSQDLAKKADLVVDGADTELDRQMIELLRDPLTHIIRNCIDHGIELPRERIAAGKSDTGTIHISAAHEAGHITLRIADDGRGLDVGRIREKAVVLGLASEEEIAQMGNDELCRFIFSQGFSTARTVTNVSGRGIGMDVVRENIESIGGTVSLSTAPGRGTTFILKVPLTLAIAPALIFEISGQRYAIAQHAVIEAIPCLQDGKSRIQYAQGAPMLDLRDQMIPVADMHAIFDLPARELEKRLALVLRAGSSTFALTVDNVADVQEIVVKPLDRTLSHLGVYAGSTILGDGSVVLILNPNGIAARIGLDGSNQFRVDTSQQDLPPEKKGHQPDPFPSRTGRNEGAAAFTHITHREHKRERHLKRR